MSNTRRDSGITGLPVATITGPGYYAPVSYGGDNYRVDLSSISGFGYDATTYFEPTDSSAAQGINRAIDAAVNAGGGLVYVRNTGSIFTLNSAVKLPSNVHLVGIGMPTLKLVSGANCNVIETPNFSTLAASDPSGQYGSVDSLIEGFILDGNRNNQTLSNIDLQCGLAVYGLNVKAQRLYIKNVFGHGTRWARNPTVNASYNRAEHSVYDIRVETCGGHGFWNKNCNDGDWQNIVVNDASQQTDNGYNGFLVETSGRHWNLHYWTASYTFSSSGNAPAYAIKQTSGGEFVACHFESANQMVWAGGGRFVNCQIYLPIGSSFTDKALVDIKGDNNIFSACRFDGRNASNAPARVYAVEFGGGYARTQLVGCYFSEFGIKGPFNFSNDGGYTSIVSGRGYASTTGGATTYAGTPAQTTSVSYEQRGNTVMSVQPPLSNTNQLSRSIHDGSSSGGNALGLGAVDIQATRGANFQAATGDYSFCGPGQFLAAVGTWSAAFQYDCWANDRYSWAFGRSSHTRLRQAAVVHAPNKFSAQGDGQRGWQDVQAITTDATPTRATTDRSAASFSNYFKLQLNEAVHVAVRIVANNGSTDAAVFSLRDVLAVCGATVADVQIFSGLTGTPATSISIPQVSYKGAGNAWSATLDVDTTNGALSVTVTGAVGKTVHWHVGMDWLEAV